MAVKEAPMDERNESETWTDVSTGPEGSVPAGGSGGDPAATRSWGAETEREAVASDERDRETIGPQNDLSGADLGEGIPGDVREYPEPTEDDAPNRAD
jgi:hypothetical protein